ncbi:hypothetical protein CRE_08559 [Caenorhabditis remanei]|uniref:Reverse transcriptase domain-containing protein n=1 Tax=Caenorhabditis remanei TaxID=31234 RepID=E3NEM8_CAERE|nr:hypothetical protein CRE_08559 [Caenorhabditis remanei]
MCKLYLRPTFATLYRITVCQEVSRLLENCNGYSVAQKRLFERVVLKPIKSELAAQLSKKQYGFLSNRSCPLALIDAVSQYHLTLSKPKACMDVILIDFRKAFDSVPHNLLLLKLMNFGLDSALCDWFKSFLSNRKSKIKIDDYISENSFHNISGVLQGTVTGPFLFLVYINDLIQSLPTDVYSIAFADDLKIYSENPSSLQKTLNVISDCCSIPSFVQHSSTLANCFTLQPLTLQIN